MHKCQKQPGPRQDYYSIEAAACYLTIGTTTLYKAVQGRQLRHKRFGKTIRITHDDLTSWILEQTVPTLADIKESSSLRSKTPKGGRQIFKKGGVSHYPPETVDDLRYLAKQIEKRMEECADNNTARINDENS